MNILFQGVSNVSIRSIRYQNNQRPNMPLDETNAIADIKPFLETNDIDETTPCQNRKKTCEKETH